MTVAARYRIENALHDLLDRLRGRCCAAPRYMIDGGYHFWRCGLRRGHDGPHRSLNYLWGPGGSLYSPIPNPPPGCDRNPVETRRQRRSRLEWLAMAEARHDAEDVFR